MRPVANTYTKTGVDVEVEYGVVEWIKKHVEKTGRLDAMGAIGGLDGCFDLSIFQLEEPVFVSGTDGVGTKLAVAIEADKHDTIGIDYVAICTNDISVQGAEPLCFLDYLATGKNDPIRSENVVKGVADGCVQGDMALIGRETTEMPGIYSGSDYDLAGFAMGIVEKSQSLTGETINPGDISSGIASSGIHSNGYSLVRKILFEQQQSSLSSELPELKKILGEVLLEPTRTYVSSLFPLIKEEKIKGAAHITGGGFVENILQMLPGSMVVETKLDTWSILPIFGCLQKCGEIPMTGIYKIFNMDIGIVLAVEEVRAEEVVREIEQAGEKVYEIRKVIAKEKHRVVLTGEER